MDKLANNLLWAKYWLLYNCSTSIEATVASTAVVMKRKHANSSNMLGCLGGTSLQHLLVHFVPARNPS